MTTKEAAEIYAAIRRLEDKLDAYMLGQPGRHNGLLGRLTRLETIDEHRRWHIRAVWTALLAVVGKFVLDLFRKL